MGQHFLLSAQARTLNMRRIARMSEDEAYAAFRAIRFAETEGQPVCIRCKCAAVYEIATRRKFKCKACLRQFSVTSGTIFASRKMEFSMMLYAIAIFVQDAKGYSALQLSRELDCQYKTAYVLAHKLRQAMHGHQAAHRLGGEVEIDGAYFGGYVKPANQKRHRIDRRLAANRTGKKQVVIVMRERRGRSLPFVGRREGDGLPKISRHLEPGSIIYADSATDWDGLGFQFKMKRINHEERYAQEEVSTNQAESFFSRLRRAEIGIHHHVAGPYLESYASDASWREDYRRVSNGEQFLMLAVASLHHPVSRQWKGYWQRRREPKQAA